MRGILFRGKRKDNGEWVYGDLIKNLIYDGREKEIRIGDIYFEHNGDIHGTAVREVIPETVGQFTGRCDENYNKIFEGDILEVSYDDGTAYTTEVCAYGGTLCVDVEGEDYDFTAIDFAVDIWKNNCCKCKVIGNIYENPELLEEL